MLKTIVRRLGSLNVMLAYVGGYVLFGMMILTTCDVIGRYLFNLPITGAYEISEAMMVTVVFFFIGYAQAAKAHVAVDLVVKVLPGKAEDSHRNHHADAIVFDDTPYCGDEHCQVA